MSIPLPSFTQQRTQVQITSPQTIQFNPAISVITNSPSAQTPQSPASGLYQPITAAQRADERINLAPFEFGRALSFPLGDVDQQMPGAVRAVQGGATHTQAADFLTSPIMLIGAIGLIVYLVARG